jgi:hypothetical protein
VTWWLRDHREPDRFVGVIPKWRALTSRNGKVLPDHQENPLTVEFHRSSDGRDEEKLLGLAVELTHLGGAGGMPAPITRRSDSCSQCPPSQLPPQT